MTFLCQNFVGTFYLFLHIKSNHNKVMINDHNANIFLYVMKYLINTFFLGNFIYLWT